MRKIAVVLLGVILLTVIFAEWKPAKSITVIVPWSAGGSTDQVTRMITSQMEPYLGRKFIIVNTPGGAGSIGTVNTWNASHDGYTWTANAVLDLTRNTLCWKKASLSHTEIGNIFCRFTHQMLLLSIPALHIKQ